MGSQKQGLFQEVKKVRCGRGAEEGSQKLKTTGKKLGKHPPIQRRCPEKGKFGRNPQKLHKRERHIKRREFS